MASLFELADHEFLSIREQTVDLQIKADAKVEAEAQKENEQLRRPDLVIQREEPTQLDVFSFMTVAKKRFPNYNFFTDAADGFVQEILDTSELTATSLDAILSQQLPRVQRYRNACAYPLNPYTQIRHALYLQDAEKYSRILFNRQRDAFERWLESDALPISSNRW